MNDEERLIDELSAVAVHIAQHTGRFLELLAECDERKVWAKQGARTAADWLAFRIQMNVVTAREHLRVARELRRLPRTLDALKRGTVSYSQVRAISRVAEPDTEEDILATARYATASQLERILAGVHRAGRARQPVEQRRRAHVFFDDDGMLVVQARLAPDEGAVLMRALDEAHRELWERPEAADRPAEQMRADALALVADRALGSGAARSGGDRTLVMVHVDEAVLRDPDIASGECRLADGAGVSAESARRLACDASVVEVRGEDVGRRTRRLGAALRRALLRRDDGRCRFPGCSCRIVDAHHAVHWAHGGDTVLDNLTCVCRHHHQLLHEGGYRVEMVAGQPRFFRPDGREILPQPPAAREPLRLDETVIARDRMTLVSRWDGNRIDYPEVVATLV